MPFALVFAGLIMVITGVKNTQGALGEQLVKDFTGTGNFLYWFVAIGSVGALGAIPGFKPFSRMFMTLIIVAMVIKNGGIFDNLTKALRDGPIAPDRPDETSDASNPTDNDAMKKLSNFAATMNSGDADGGSLLGNAGKWFLSTIPSPF